MKSMKSHEDRIKKLSGKAKDLEGNAVAGDDGKAIEREMSGFVEKWDDLLKKCVFNKLYNLKFFFINYFIN